MWTVSQEGTPALCGGVNRKARVHCGLEMRGEAINTAFPGEPPPPTPAHTEALTHSGSGGVEWKGGLTQTLPPALQPFPGLLRLYKLVA